MREKVKSVYGENCKKIKWTKRFKAGYFLQREGISHKSTKKLTYLTVAYNLNGDYIGDSKWAYRACVKFGIKPELADKKDKTCSIGYCKLKRKWYGYSHRAIFGYGIGYITKKGGCETTSGFTDCYLKKHPEANVSLPVGFKAKNLEDCKKMAIAFAESVS